MKYVALLTFLQGKGAAIVSLQSPNDAACLVIAADDGFITVIRIVNSGPRGNYVGKL